MPSADWNQTKLWAALSSKTNQDAREVLAVLTVLTTDVLKTLDAGTADTSFTLHDSDHAFRVAEWMARIVPSDLLNELSAYELGLLILSAYLHDVGMSPDGGLVQRIWNHLAFGPEKSQLAPDEADALQGWLDERGDGVQIPIFDGPIESAEQRATIDELVAYFCRDRHNEWSKDFIRRIVEPRLPRGRYARWADDLILLCQSHHFGYERLKADDLNPRQIDGSGAVVHMRYLACVLRVADILDIDPERTPEVIFKHRAIRESSLLHWRKNHDAWITVGERMVLLTAEPESAVVEKAIRTTGDEIREELELCGRLSREPSFDRASFGPLPHRWTFPESLNPQIQPRPGTYIYIDGSFRPDTRKVLDLLGGTQLYSRPIVAARELLQNAFDAVREAIALERVARSRNSRDQDPDGLARSHEVQLRVERRDNSYWLMCTDTGVGMTRQIISNHLLVGGRSHRAQLAALERECQQAGFALARSGQFGIGVLSYFMLSDCVEIVTRRTPMYGEAVSGLRFTTAGPGSFGELRAVPHGAPGTEVSLRLRSEVVRDPEAFVRDLSSFVRQTFVRVPCRFVLSASFAAAQSIELEPGWTTSLSDIREQLLNSLFPQEHDARLQPSAVVAELKRRNEAAGVLAKLAGEHLRLEATEATLPGHLGEVRAVIPYFDLKGSRSIAWVLGRDVRFSKGGITTCCGGAPVGLDWGTRWHSPSRCTISFEDRRCGQIGVARQSLNLSKAGSDAMVWAHGWIEKLEERLWFDGTSKCHEVNRRVFPNLSKGSKKPCWYHSNSNDWKPVSTPAIASEHIDVELAQGNRWVARWKEQDLFVGESLPLPRKDFEMGLGLIPPDRVVLASVSSPLESPSEPSLQLGGLYFSDAERVQRGCSLFPPDWGSVLGADLGATGVFWNCGHPWSQVDDVYAIGRMRRGPANDENAGGQPIFWLRELRDRLSEPGVASQVMAYFIWNMLDGADRWLTLCEHEPQFADELWDAVGRFRLGAEQVFILAERKSVAVLSRQGLQRLSWREALGRQLVRPTAEWRIGVRQERIDPAPGEAILPDKR